MGFLQFLERLVCRSSAFVQTQSVNATVARGVCTAVLRVSIAGGHSLWPSLVGYLDCIECYFHFFDFFHNFPAIFHYHLQFSAFSSVFLAKVTRLHVTPSDRDDYDPVVFFSEKVMFLK